MRDPRAVRLSGLVTKGWASNIVGSESSNGDDATQHETGSSAGNWTSGIQPAEILPVALSYIDKGWTVVPLHWIENGLCTCGNVDLAHTRRQGGKHPIHANWQIASLRDAGSVNAYWRAHPRANVGIATGRASGIWVLDVDPDNGGDVALQALIEAHGPLPLTRKQQTGSGGYHLIWRMPPDFEPTNSRGRLPVGLDVRGTGGQIVAPPSVSGKGGYFVLSDAEPVDAPAWLLDMIRPAPYSGMATTTPAPDSMSIENTRVFSTGEVGNSGRSNAYASRVMGDECRRLAQAPEGMRNETAFRVACRLWELINAGWVPADGAHNAYIAACELADSAGSPFPPNEAESVWAKAWRKVGGAAAVLPPDMLHGEALPFASSSGPAMPGGVPLAPGGGSVALPMSAAVVGNGGQAGGGSALIGLFADPAPVVGNAVATPLQQAFPAQRTPIEMLRERLRTGVEFAAMPPPAPLVAGLLDRDSIAYMIGRSGSYKSFVALDIACAVACDTPWRGRRVHAGTVLYLCAEGQAGAHLRVKAWMQARKRADTGALLVLDVPVQARDAVMWSAFVELCRELGPVLIVIDTQARCSLGFEENSNSDMSLFVGQVDALRAATGACVLVVHHIGRSGGDARGASAIDGAQDAELRVERGASPLTCKVSTDKQKDRPDDVAIELKLDVVPMGWDPLTGEDRTSLVISDEVPAVVTPQDRLTTYMTMLVGVLCDGFDAGEGGSRDEIGTQFRALPEVARLTPAGQRSALKRAWDELIERRRIMRLCGLQRFRFIRVDRLGDLDKGPEAPFLPGGWEVWLGEQTESDSPK